MFKNSKGFTLIEVLIVIAILGILSTVIFVDGPIDIAKQRLENIKSVVSTTDIEIVERASDELMKFMYRGGSGYESNCKQYVFLGDAYRWKCLARAEQSNGITSINKISCEPNLESGEIDCEIKLEGD